MKVENVAVDKLNPAAYNPRQIEDDVLDKLALGLKKFGCVEPIIVNKRTGNVVGGHQRIVAAKRAGIDILPVTYVDLPDNEEKALNLALNKISGDWDFSKLADMLVEMDAGDLSMDLTGFSEAELEELATWTPDDDDDGTVGGDSSDRVCPKCGYVFTKESNG